MKNKKKKWIIIVIVVLLVLALVLGFFFFRRKAKEQVFENFSYVRTVTLGYSNLQETVVASGTIESQATSTISAKTNDATVSKINYKVGDYVKEGDIVIELDTTNIYKQIDKQNEKVEEQKQSLQDRYDNAQEDYDDAEDEYDSAKATRTSAANAFSAVKDAVESFQAAYSNAYTAYNDKINDCLENEDKACDLLDDTNVYKTNWTNAKKELEEAKKTLDAAKEANNYDALEKAYQEAESAYQSAKNKYKQAESTFEEAEDELDEGVDTESLDDLYDDVSDYQLKAKSSGQITSINAVLGSNVNGTLATIQDTSMLKISLTIDEYDILKLSLGMKAIIETDASDKKYDGEVSQISPVASSGQMGSSGSFEIEVKVTSEDISDLLIGMNAEVTIVISETDQNFNVPIDAIEERSDGTKVIYVQNDNDEFETVEVETGETNGYYVEIFSSQLQEGMKVRASANIDEAKISATEDEETSQEGFGGFDMGGMPSGGFPPGGGGMPSGGFSGGGMPSGGFGGR